MLQNLKTSINTTRRRCEHNVFELITAAVFAIFAEDSSAVINKSTVFEFIDQKESKLTCLDKKEYLADKFNKEKKFPKYINELVNQIKTNPLFMETISNIDRVIVTGKQIVDLEIISLNSGLDVKDAKSDIYFKMKSAYFTPYIGMSVKQDKHCTKTNYSVTKLLSPEDRNLCKSVKLAHLEGCERVIKTDDSSTKKQKRMLINKKFYNRNNPYFNILAIKIQENHEYITNTLVNALLSSKVPYPVYEFNGSKLSMLTSQIPSNIHFHEEASFYLDTKGKRRQTAKMFYKLTFNTGVEVSQYRVEIRWKGAVHTASPQFQCHSL
tara:strand:+ start:307 stop:1278 length:972 start_codon:yes stop_codon:yes gene_type:complete